MAEYSSPFNDSILNHFETNSQQALSYFDGSYVEDGWVFAVDQPILLRFLKRLQKGGEPLKFYWGNFKGPMSTVKHTSNAFDGESEYSATYPGDKKIRVGENKLESMHVRIRARVGESIDPNLAYAIDFDLSNSYRLRQVTYKIYFLFVEGTEQKDDDLIAHNSRIDSNNNRINEDRIVAVKFETHNYYSFALLAEALDFEIEDIIKKKFDAAYNEIPSGAWETKRTFYERAPKSYLLKGDIDIMWKDFKGLVKFDYDSSWDDSSNAMVRCLGTIAGHKGGMEFLYKKFNDSGSYIKTIYNLLQSSSYSSDLHRESPNKAVFASLLLAICSYQGQGLNSKRNKTKDEFRIDKSWYTTHGMDNKMGYYTLTPMKWKEGEKFPEYKEGVAFSGNMRGFKPQRDPKDFHPLDMVTLWLPSPVEGGESFKMYVPAIFVYNIAYERQWAAIAKLIRLGVNLLIIAVSAATLSAGAGALFTLISITEIGFASADLAIQAFEDEIRSIKPGGAEFLDKWEEIYFAQQFVTGFAALPALAGAAGKIILKVSEGHVGQFVRMIEQILIYIDEFPEFVGDFAIYTLTDYRMHFSGDFANAMKNLNEEGAILIKGKELGDVKSSLFLNYEGVMIAKGDAKEITDLVKSIGGKGKKEIQKLFSKLYKIKSGTGGGFKYIDEVESAKMVGQELEMSCGAASVKQLALDQGVDVSEEAIRLKAGFKEDGINPYDLGPVVQDLFPNRNVYSGSFDYEGLTGAPLLEAANSIADGPWIVSLGPSDSQIHTIIVDDVLDGIVKVRDPWNSHHVKGYGNKFGVEAKIKIEDFLILWKSARFHFIIIK